MNVPPPDIDWLAAVAESTPDAVALVEDDGTEISYVQLDALAEESAAKMRRDTGLVRGDLTVVAVHEVGVPLVAMLWGLWRSGVAPLLIDHRSPLVRLWAAAVRSWLREDLEHGNLHALPPDSVYADQIDVVREVFPRSDVNLHTVVLTSGSTVGPRPVRLTRANVAAAIAASRARLGNDASDCWLLNLPLFHVGGLSVLWRSAAAGGSVVVHDRFDAKRTAQAMKDGTATVTSLVPTMLHRVLEADPGPYHGMKAVLLGGAAADRDLVERALDAGLPTLQTYGMTETCSQVATVAPGEEVESLGTAGRPLDGMKVVIDGDEVGEIIVDGPAVSPGYLGEPERSRGHRTGDLGYLDGEGRLVVLGRVDDMIVTGGENVYPQRVADVLSRHRFIRRVEVVGMPDPEWGQAIVAVVVGDRTTRRRLARWARERLPKHELPKQWIFVDELPMLSNGKVDRAALAEIARRAH
jgi:O-succinylbenzoic acid--CoA ligase